MYCTQSTSIIAGSLQEFIDKFFIRVTVDEFYDLFTHSVIKLSIAGALISIYN